MLQKKKAALAVSALALCATTVQANDKWDISLGAGIMTAAEYEGSNNYETKAVPSFEITYDDTYYLSMENGLGMNFYQTESLNISGGISMTGGRDEKDSSHLADLGDIDSTAAANLNFEYNLDLITPHLNVVKHLGESKGTEVTIGVSTYIPVGLLTGTLSHYDVEMANSDLEVGPAIFADLSTTWADNKYNNTFFGVTDAQAAKSKYNAEKIGSGFKAVNLDLGLNVPLNANWSLDTMISYSKLLGDVADSQLVREDDSIMGGMFVKYKF